MLKTLKKLIIKIYLRTFNDNSEAFKKIQENS